jgi:glutathione synthase
MAMKYLKKVNQGDKRILVVAGVCLGAVLRVPKSGSWLCNLAQGATSESVELTKEESYIVNMVDPMLSKEGINVYGIDTLVDDDGKRIMSEINTTNVGGFVQLQETSEIDILHKTVELMFNRLEES